MKKNGSIAVLIFIVLVAFYPKLVNGQNIPPVNSGDAGPWRYLGEKVISFSVGSNFIDVKKVGVFRKLKFKVLGAPVKMGGLKVGLENGEMLEMPLQISLEEGRESKILELIGLNTNIKVVYFTYLPMQQGDSRKPKIILLGQL